MKRAVAGKPPRDMSVLQPSGSLQAQLDPLADALGGSWFLLERTADGLTLVAATDEPAGPVSPPDPVTILTAAENAGAVVRIGLGRPSHPAGRALAGPDRGGPGAGPPAVERILAGTGLAGGKPDRSTTALLAVVLGGLSALLDAADQAIQDRAYAERLELRAATDPLTGLFNRRGWDRLLLVEEDRCQRHGLDAEIVVIDLDELKAINDTAGHEAGDAAIVRAATFIFSAVRIHDAVARLGGDEFAVLAGGTDGVAGRVGRRIEAALEEAGVAASVGSATRSERGSLAEAWRAADLRMYRMKQRHRRASLRGVPTPQPLA